MRFPRVFLIVLDSVGVGAMPDAHQYQDNSPNTIAHIAEVMGGLTIPNLASFGMGHLTPIQNVQSVSEPQAYYAKMAEYSKGKDTTIGHWELMGVPTLTPFQVYPQGFPQALIDEIENMSGRKVLGNIPASGTEIIERYGKEQLEKGGLIVYTSADSVLQIAAHEEVVPIEELYRICQFAREKTLEGKNKVCRVIARPFIGEVGKFTRTARRKDFSVKPPQATVLDGLKENGFASIGIGKIGDIFAHEGITRSILTESNDDGVEKLLNIANEAFKGLAFLNLVDFDAKYGHRRDPIGYGRAIERFDQQLSQIKRLIGREDLLIITADHGNDPTHAHTDHTREYVPLFIYNPLLTQMKSLGVRDTFADVGATIADNFSLTLPPIGTSLLPFLK